MKKSCFVLLCLFPLLSCSQNKNPDSLSPKTPIQKFSTLRFEADGKPCLASINNRYIGFKEKAKFSLSLFITVNTIGKNKDGHPDEKEALVFNTLQTGIISELSKILGTYCYAGTTTMTNYRDILLYIKPEDQKKATEILEKFKPGNSRLASYTFEKDSEWEAVASFYEAIGNLN